LARDGRLRGFVCGGGIHDTFSSVQRGADRKSGAKKNTLTGVLAMLSMGTERPSKLSAQAHPTCALAHGLDQDQQRHG
jgi:hypothetical protein